ncbi:MAG TPA: 50S ribosomal protein L21 [Candidatus Paceibacterota bacterium]
MSTQSSVFAVIIAGGKQYKVAPGMKLKIEKINDELKAGDAVTFSEVTLVSKDGNVTVGAPTVAGASVIGEFIETTKDAKIRVAKFRAKSNYHKVYGHRQPHSYVLIKDIK